MYYDYDLRGLELYARYATDSGLGVTREFDGFARLIHESNNSSGKNFTITHQYDDNINRTEITHPDGQSFQYAYDGLDRRTTIKEKGGAIIQTQTFDAYARPKAMVTPSTTTNIGYSASEIAVVSINHDFIATSKDITFGYDYNAASQLTSLQTSNKLYKHSANVVGETGNYAVNGLNQYTSVNGKSINHDVNGNLSKEGNKGYYYDVENRLTGTSSYVGLKYDPLGRLNTLKVYTGPVKTFLYDGDALIAEYEGTTMVNRYVHGGGVDNPVVMYKGSGVKSGDRYALHSNYQGSIIASSQGSSVAINNYDSYGVPSAGNQGRFGYTGQLYLHEIGLNYYKARIYHPKLGRFLQTDPIGYDDGMNMYAYVGNDPVNAVDSTGKAKVYTWNAGKIADGSTSGAGHAAFVAKDGTYLTMFPTKDGWSSLAEFHTYEQDVAIYGRGPDVIFDVGLTDEKSANEYAKGIKSDSRQVWSLDDNNCATVTVNALNAIIRRVNNGVLDKTFQVDWSNYQNSFILTDDDDYRVIELLFFKKISWS